MSQQVSDTFAQMKSEFEGLEAEVAKFDKGNNSAGARARKHALNIANLSKQLRKDVSEAKVSKLKLKFLNKTNN